MALTITIGGTIFTETEAQISARTDSTDANPGGLDWTSLTIEDVFAPSGDLCTISGTFHFPEDIPLRVPETEQEITISFDGTVIFGGIVEEVSVTLRSFNTSDITLRCRDYTKWLSGKLVSGVFVDSTAGEMVTNIINTFTDGFTTTFVNNVGTVLPKVFNWVPIHEAIQEIAEVVDAVWWVDFNRNIHFISGDDLTNSAPVSLYDVDTELELGDLKYTISTSDIQNSLIVKDFFLRGPNFIFTPADDTQQAFATTGHIVDSIIASRKSFQLEYPPYELADVEFQYKVAGGSFVDKIAQWDAIPGSGPLDNRYVYVKPGSGVGGGAWLRWSFPTSIGDELRIKYRPLLSGPFPEITREPFSINEFSRRQTLGGRTSDGIYERLINFSDLEFGGNNPIEVLAEFGGIILKTRAWPLIEGSFECLSNQYSGWRAGQKFGIISESLNLFDLQSWIRNNRPSGTFANVKFPLPVWVKSVRIQALSHDLLKYTIDFTSRLRSL